MERLKQSLTRKSFKDRLLKLADFVHNELAPRPAIHFGIVIAIEEINPKKTEIVFFAGQYDMENWKSVPIFHKVFAPTPEVRVQDIQPTDLIRVSLYKNKANRYGSFTEVQTMKK